MCEGQQIDRIRAAEVARQVPAIPTQLLFPKVVGRRPLFDSKLLPAHPLLEVGKAHTAACWNWPDVEQELMENPLHRGVQQRRTTVDELAKQSQS